MNPLVLFQIPFGGQFLIANGAFVHRLVVRVLFHMHLQTRLDVLFVAMWTLDRVAFE